MRPPPRSGTSSLLASLLLFTTACGSLLDASTDSLHLGLCGVGNGGQAGGGGKAGGAGSAGKGGSSGGGGHAGSSAGGAGKGGSSGGAGSGGSAGEGGGGGGGHAGSSAGAAGEGGSAGSGGVAGEGGGGGEGGTAGGGGHAGSSAGAAGEGGSAGSAGGAGEGGSAGSAGGAGSGGAAGDAGAGGQGGEGGGVVALPGEALNSAKFSTFKIAEPLGKIPNGFAAHGSKEGTILLYHRDDTGLLRRAKYLDDEKVWVGYTTQPEPGIVEAEPAVVWPSLLHLFVLRQGMIHNTYDANDGLGWRDYTVGDGEVTSAPAVIAKDSYVFDAFARRSNGELWRATSHTNKPGTWVSLEGQLAPGSPAAVSDKTGSIHVFARWTDNHLHHRWFDGSQWQAWEDWQGNLASGPSAASWGDNRLDVVARGQNGTLHYLSRPENSNATPEWKDTGVAITEAPVVVALGFNKLRVLIRTPQGEVAVAELIP